MNQLSFSKKKIISIFSILSIVIIFASSTSFATIFSGGRTSANFNAYYDSSVASFGYTNAYDAARADWNAASNSVNVGKTTSTSGNPDKYYVGNTSVTGLLGVQAGYNSSGQILGTNETWTYSTVSIYHNQMEDYRMSFSEKISNATHEVGHTLSQAHPVTSQNSVMKQGIQSIGVQDWDKGSLIAKWGN